MEVVISPRLDAPEWVPGAANAGVAAIGLVAIGPAVTGMDATGMAIGTTIMVIIMLSSSVTSAFQDGGAGAGEIHIGATHMDIMDMAIRMDMDMATAIRMGMEAMDTVITGTETAMAMAAAEGTETAMAAPNMAPLLGRK